MAVTVEEKPNGIEQQEAGANSYREVTYIVRGTRSQNTAGSNVKTHTTSNVRPAGWDRTLRRRSIRVNPVNVQDNIGADRCVWDVIVRYEADRHDDEEVNPEGTYRWTVAGATEKVNRSMDTISRYGDWTNYNEAIGVKHDGDMRPTIEGVDLIKPEFSFSITHYFDRDTVDFAYRTNVADLVGTVNNATFKGFAKGNVLFTGMDGSEWGEEFYELVFNFHAKKGRVQTIGDIVGITSEGWQYVWVEYEQEIGTDTNGDELIIPTPKAAYVEQVYEYGDFSILDIGT